MRSREATLPLKQGGVLYGGCSKEYCAMYGSMTQRCRKLSCLMYVPADAAKRKALVFFIKGVKGR